jgi:hypothetical protein
MQSLTDMPVRFERRHGLWIAAVLTCYGIVEVVLDGSAEAPDKKQLTALEPYFERASEITEATKKKLKFSFLYRLIRIAPNQDGRVGLQFRNRLTGAQSLLFIDE